MTQTQLVHAVARSTGESVRTVRHLGFSIQRVVPPPDRSVDDVRLVLDCPFCGRPVPYPGRAGDGSAAMAECDRDDVYFGFDPREVYAAPAAGA
jgi:hypothetical protein